MQFRLECHEVLESTSSLVKQRADAGEAEGLAIQALRQSAGRGRQGRGWDSPAGNLYISVLLRPAVPLRDAPQWSFVAAVALAETLNGLLPEASKLSLKWPNDVLVEGKKISGILLEGLSLPGGHQGVVIGCGINIAHHPSDTLYPVTDLKSAGVITSPFEVFGHFSASFEKWLAVYRGGEGFGDIREHWLSFAHGVGGLIVVKDRKEEKVGIFAGLDREGRLLLDQNGQIEPVIVGDVFFRDS